MSWRSLSTLLSFVCLLPQVAAAQSDLDPRFVYKTVVTSSTPGASQFEHPTTMAFAPDGRLFIAQRNGKIHYLTLNSLYEVVGNVGRIDAIFNITPYGRTITGMTFATNGDLYVSSSDGRIDDDQIGTSSGAVSRLAAPNYNTVVHVVTGLPRSKRDHGPNGLFFKDGKLYVAQAGMTNIGLKSTTNIEFWTVEETQNSAAILEFDLAAGGPPNRIATGLRNPYEILVHSNGNWYVNDNGPNPPGAIGNIPNSDCTDSGNGVTAGADELHLIQRDAYYYYGHPNPARSECVFNGGVPPIHTYGNNVSANGIAEYTSYAIPALRGQIITSRLAGAPNGGGSIVSVNLNAPVGVGQLAMTVLVNNLHHPIDVVTTADGGILIAEHNWDKFDFGFTSKISVLIPKKTAPGDFDGDGRSDLTVYRPGYDLWLTNQTNGSQVQRGPWGVGGDIPVLGDWDGDRRSELIVYRPSTMVWHFSTSLANWTNHETFQWGGSGDKPVPADYDGDGRLDVAVFRAWNARWYLNFSSGALGGWAEVGPFGEPNDIFVPGDWDGDGRADLIVYRPSTQIWHFSRSSTNWTNHETYQWGIAGDQPVPADYDGDGRLDVAVFRPSNGHWYVIKSWTGTFADLGPWGTTGDIPLPLDVDGDRRADLIVYRPSTQIWHQLTSSTNWTNILATQWGTTGDIPLGIYPY